MEDREDALLKAGCERVEETHRERRDGRRVIVARVSSGLGWMGGGGESGGKKRERESDGSSFFQCSGVFGPTDPIGLPEFAGVGGRRGWDGMGLDQLAGF